MRVNHTHGKEMVTLMLAEKREILFKFISTETNILPLIGCDFVLDSVETPWR